MTVVTTRFRFGGTEIRIDLRRPAQPVPRRPVSCLRARHPAAPIESAGRGDGAVLPLGQSALAAASAGLVRDVAALGALILFGTMLALLLLGG